MTQGAIVTYCYVVDAEGKLEGLVVMRDMLLATPDTKLADIMLKDVFSLGESTKLSEALKLALHKAKGTPLPEEWGTSVRDLVFD